MLTTLITVNTFDDVVNAGDSVTSLREAIIHANSTAGDFEIQLQAGTYWLTRNGSNEDAASTGDLDILNNGSIIIVGVGAGQTVINAGGNGGSIAALGDRVFQVHSGASLGVKEITVTGGTAAGSLPNNAGGGFYVDGGTLVVTNSILSGNSAFYGGGIDNSGSVTVTNSTLSGNSATLGGGIYNLLSGSVTLTNSILSGSAVSSGGGIYNSSSSSVTVTNSILSGNSASNLGGGIRNFGTVIVTNSSVSANTAGIDGGGIATDAGSVTITNSTVSGNTAASDGGGVFNSGTGTSTVSNSTISANTATRFGGGIYNAGSTTVTNTTVSGNTAGFAGGGIGNAGAGTVTVRNSTFTGNRADANGVGSHGGGIAIGILFTGSNSQALLHNTIIAGNVKGLLGSEIDSDIETLSANVDSASTYNLIGNPNVAGGLMHGVNGNVLGDGSGNLLAISAILDTTLANNGGPTRTHALVPGSPAINAGDPNFIVPPEFDQRGTGFGRVVHGRVDIGAFEVQNSAPTAVLTASPQSGASPLSVTLDGSQSFDLDIGDSIVQYIWNVGNNQLVTTATPQLQHTYSAAGTYQATLVVQDSLGVQSAPASVTIVVNSAPTAVLTASPQSGASPLSVTLDGSQSFDPDIGDSIVRYIWNVGNNLPVQTNTPEFQFTYPWGQYLATLVVEDSFGNRSTPASIVITANAAPTAVLQALPPQGSPPLTVTLDGSQSFDPDIGDSIVQYIWNVGNNQLVTTATPQLQHTYSAAGTYQATLVVQDSLGVQSAPSSVTIVVNSAPTADAGGPYTVPEGTSIQLNATGSFDNEQPNTTLTYEWDLNYDGVFQVDVIGIQPSVSFPDNFAARTIALRVTDSGGLSHIATTTLEVTNVAPTATFTASSLVTYGTAIAIGFTDPFDPSLADNTAGFRYAFNLDPVALAGATYAASSADAADSILLDAGVYTIYARIIDKDDGFTQYSTTVTVNPATLTVTADSQTRIYGNADPALTFVASGFQLGDTTALLTGGLTRAAGENVGSYAISQGTLDAGSNYTLDYVAANLLITPRSIEVTADALSKTYGENDPPLTYQITDGSLAFLDAFFGTLGREAGEDAGSYAINQGSLGLSNNYDLRFVEAELVIHQATLTGDATTQDALNMAKQGMLNITVSNITGFVNGENAEVFLTNASFWIVIDDTKYEFVPTSVTKLSNSSISIRYSLKNSALLEAFGTALEDATSGKTAIEAGFSMASTNYNLSDEYLTRLFNTGK